MNKLMRYMTDKERKEADEFVAQATRGEPPVALQPSCSALASHLERTLVAPYVQR